MNFFETEELCFDYFISHNIKNRNELRQLYKLDPISGISQSLIENIFSLYKKEMVKKVSKTTQNVQTVVLSDLHIPNQDDTTLNNVYNFLDDLQPNRLVLLGDIIDCYWCSKFLKNPKNTKYLQDEADLFYKIMSKIKRIIPKTELYYVLGNHEERIFKNQWESPQYIGLRALAPKTLLRLDKLKIKYVENKLILNDFIYYHGDKVRNNSAYSAKAEFEGFQMKSGISGHTHRLGSYFHTCDENVEFWYENGCLCKLNPEYLKAPKVNWQQGFSIVNHFLGMNQVEQILIQNHIFRYNGVIYS